MAQEKKLPEIKGVKVTVSVGEPMFDSSLGQDHGYTIITGITPKLEGGILHVDVSLEVYINADYFGSSAYDTAVMLETDHVIDFTILAQNKYADYLQNNFVGKSFTRTAFDQAFAKAGNYYTSQAKASYGFWDYAGYRANTWHNWNPSHSSSPRRPSDKSIYNHRLNSFGAGSL